MPANNENIKTQLATLPNKSGVYRFFNKEGILIYVGKAKNLKKRVSSYFNKKQFENAKTITLVRKIERLEFTVVDSEFDALLLENNLIKKYQPRYNIQLRDDKSFPWICIKNERFPRVFYLRNPKKDGAEYYGPYSSVKVIRTLMNFIKELYPIRTCSYNLSKENIENKKFKVCLEYHIKKCKGACEALQSEESYNKTIDAIRNIIKGDLKVVTNELKKEMQYHAENYQFELAQQTKEKIDLVEKYQAKSTIVNPQIKSVDVFAIDSDINSAYVNFFKVKNGGIIQAQTIEIKKKLEETNDDLLKLAIIELRTRFNSDSKEVLTSIPIDDFTDSFKLSFPQRGDRKKLVDLSLKNAKEYKLDKYKQQKIVDPEKHQNRILNQLKVDLRLKEEPKHIECFDNSNFQGTNAVAACVVFKNAKPAKKEYRHFNIKTVEGPNDFASMEEVVYRRYKRLLDEDKSLPQLIVIDGGKGQLSSAVKSLDKLNIRGKVAIIGIAKKLEEIYYPNDSIPLYLDKRSESLKVIQHLRNEAHRFGITFHRNKRSKNSFNTELDQIKGVGEKSIEKLLKHFKSVKRIKKSKKEELIEVVGKKQGGLVFEYFNGQ